MNSTWTSAHQIRHYIMDDPLLDWLELYGESKDFTRDKVQPVFLQYLSQQKNSFKNVVISDITKKIPNYIEIDVSLPVRRRVAFTIDAMYLEYDMILRGGVFFNSSQLSSQLSHLDPSSPSSGKDLPSFRNDSIQRGWYGIPDILIKADKISKIFPNITLPEGKVNSYIPVTIAYSTLRFSQTDNTRLLQNQKLRYYQAFSQLLQQACHHTNKDISTDVPETFTDTCGILIGRSTRRNNQWNYARIPYEIDLLQKAIKGVTWIQHIQVSDASRWELYPPSRPELYPNMRYCDEDYPWHETKKIIAQKLNDITLLWQCGPQQRIVAHQKGIFNWNQIDDTEVQLSLSAKKSQIIDKIISINRSSDDSRLMISPRKLKNHQNIQQLQSLPLEFYVDFETVQEVDETDNPSTSTQNFLFMIGCVSRYQINSRDYHCEYKSFMVRDLIRTEEQRITRDWIDYMSHFQKIFPKCQPKIFHWSPAEPVIYQQLTSKWGQILPVLPFVDLLQIFQKEPIVVRGAFSYSLKAVSRALYHHKYIQTLWRDDVVDGKDAMIRAWMCYQPEHSHQKKEVLGNIEHYNYVDCKVMEEIVSFIREKLL